MKERPATVTTERKWTDEHEIGRLMEQRDQLRADVDRLRAALREEAAWLKENRYFDRAKRLLERSWR